MPKPIPDKASRMEALRLAKRLVRLKSDWASEPTLAYLPPHIVAALQHGIEEAAAVRATLAWGGLVAGVLLTFGFSSHHTALAVAALFACGLLFARMTVHVEQMQRCMVYALTQTQNVAVLPTLIKATHHAWGRTPAVLAAIRRLLEQVTEEDIGLLNRDEQEILWTLAVLPLTLRNNADEAFGFSALQAFARIGDGETLTAMRRIANRSAVYPAEHRLNAQVQALILQMETRIQRQQSLQTLLRASDTPDMRPDTMLRAHTSPASEPQQLLRAGLAEPGDRGG